jgi:predicted phosphodiesterase
LHNGEGQTSYLKYSMRYALLSDVHGNLPALNAVLADIAALPNVDATYHLGDLVGYAPWPNEVVMTLRDAEISGVAGNYDSTTATGYKHCGCKYEDPEQERLSHLSYEWTKAHTSTETKRYLASLPFRIDVRPRGGHASGPTVILVHGNQTLNTVYVTEDRSDEFLSKMGTALGAKSGDVVCFGHTHKPWHREIGGVHFVNTGSVGRPKDGDWRAGYVMLDVSDHGIIVRIVRVPYALEATMAAIRESDLPDAFADYLQSGGKPAVAS